MRLACSIAQQYGARMIYARVVNHVKELRDTMKDFEINSSVIRNDWKASRELEAIRESQPTQVGFQLLCEVACNGAGQKAAAVNTR